jgi:atlastin
VGPRWLSPRGVPRAPLRDGNGSHLTPSSPPPNLQIISISDDGLRFSLDREKLAFVLAQVPESLPVSVVSVVGAFRTGKSFVLDLFLRYLRAADAEWRAGGSTAPAPPLFEPGAADGRAAWLYSGGSALEGSMAGGAADFAPASAGQGERTGFKWRSGNDRCTTGIWFWSRPFLVRRPGGGGPLAVLLMDTQGMFDNQTSQKLTSCIFGLSTLISSYLIYNVANRIGEDNLQHLALFTEYARIASCAGARDRGEGAAQARPSGEEEGGKEDGGSLRRETLLDRIAAASPGTTGAVGPTPPPPRADKRTPPFQRLEFLVRDSTTIAPHTADAGACTEHMASYLDAVFSQVALKDLRTVRTQILECFNHVSCYMLVHPGATVAEEPSFTGAIDDIRDKFRVLLERYVHLVFDRQLEPKRSPTGHKLTAKELGHYIEQYVTMFQEDARFPEAQVLLTATAEANNRAAKDAATACYTRLLAQVTNHGTVHVREETMAEEEARARTAALELFTLRADFGPSKDIAKFRGALVADLTELGRDAIASNKARNPWVAIEPYLFALQLFLGIVLLRQALEWTCAPWAEVCKHASASLSIASSLLLIGFVFVVYQSGAVTWGKLSALADMGIAAGGGGPGIKGAAAALRTMAETGSSGTAAAAEAQAVAAETREADTPRSDDVHGSMGGSTGLRRRAGGVTSRRKD